MDCVYLKRAEYLDTAIEAGKALCENVLEPLQDQLGRICIRSAYRSCAVNAKGAENRNQYNCSRNESNYAGHFLGMKDSKRFIGATACIVVTSFIPYYERTKKEITVKYRQSIYSQLKYSQVIRKLYIYKGGI